MRASYKDTGYTARGKTRYSATGENRATACAVSKVEPRLYRPYVKGGFFYAVKATHGNRYKLDIKLLLHIEEVYYENYA